MATVGRRPRKIASRRNGRRGSECMPSPFIWTTSEISKLKLEVGKFLATVRAARPLGGGTVFAKTIRQWGARPHRLELIQIRKDLCV
jgi:hypothetical protein